ncbi:MAG TPA: GNAT family N-acetyltransferase [Solirubrobacterales bacterium]|nr:GNAT family N-acetyltransferase [Solirubrobacterales bacterium]
MAEQAHGIAYDPRALDETERRFWRECWESVPADVAAERGIELRNFGPIQASAIASLPEVRMLNLVLGAAEPGALEGGHLADALDWTESLGVDCYVPVKPGSAEASAAEDRLKSRGYELGYAWMKFVRDPSPSTLYEPEGVEVVELTAGEGEPLGRIGAEGFNLPPWAGAFFRDLPGREGWRCYAAEIDGRPQACAAMLIHNGVAEFGIAATLEIARGRGCQTALLHRRIEDARAAGCHTLFVETGERTTDRPSASYRNILRAGFKEAYLRPNWRHPDQPRT